MSPANTDSSRENSSRTTIILLSLFLLGLALLIVPKLVGISETGFWGHLLRDLGIAAVPLSAIALIYEHILREAIMNEMREKLGHTIRTHFEVVERVARAGLIDALPEFPTTRVADGFGEAKSIRILQTWIPDAITLLRPLQIACMRGAKVRILLLDPESPIAPKRALELGYSQPNATADNVNANLQEIRRFCTANGLLDHVEVRLYDALPVIAVHAIDDLIYVGTFWRKMPSINGPQLVARGSASFYVRAISQHFEDLWESSRIYDIRTTQTPNEPTRPQRRIRDPRTGS